MGTIRVLHELEAGAERVWVLRKGTEYQTGELFKSAAVGIEFRLTRNGKWYFRRQHRTRAIALQEAVAARKELENDGWIEADD